MLGNPRQKTGTTEKQQPKSHTSLIPKISLSTYLFATMPLISGSKTMTTCLVGSLLKQTKEKLPIFNVVTLEILSCILSTDHRLFLVITVIFYYQIRFLINFAGKHCLDSWPSSGFNLFIIHSPTHIGNSLQLNIAPCLG